MSDNYSHFITQDGKLISIRNDELYHFKYLKREKVNGKWRYYYNNPEYQSYQKALETQAEVNKSVKKAKTGRKALKNANFDSKLEKGTRVLKQDIKLIVNKAMLTIANDKVSEAKRRYEKTGGAKIAKLFNAASNAVYKGKKFIEKLF